MVGRRRPRRRHHRAHPSLPSAGAVRRGRRRARGCAHRADESTQDWNWDGIYTTEARITDEGWVLEVEIPFTTIRFDDPTAPEMGIALYRSIRRKNEHVYWPHIGQEYRGGIVQVSRYGRLTGLRDLRRGRHIEVKPYAITGATKSRAGATDTEIDAGLDVKAALSSSLTLDLTYNTDFAQVEADNVQINLTRFDLFFPEKREFFLERAALFQFGAPRETEVFFSRRVGLDADIVGGGRVTGETGPFSVGALSLAIEAPTESPIGGGHEWSSVARVQGNLRPRTTLGGIVTSKDGDGHNRVVGVDFLTRFWSSSSLFLWGADISDSRFGVQTGSTFAGQVELMLQNDRYLFELTRTEIGEDFSPALGFVPRPDQKRWGGQIGFSPRFQESAWARQLSTTLGANHITGMDGEKQSHFRRLGTRLDFQSADNATADVSERFERLEEPALINGREIPAGDYTFHTVSAGFTPNRARELGVNTLQANVRVDWIHTPGSDLFVVLDTGYLTGPLQDPRDSRWMRRTGVVKLTYLKAF